MKNIIFYLIYFFTSVHIFAESLQFPKEIKYHKSEFSSKNTSIYGVVRAFHPIGWSENGKFAYVNFYSGYHDNKIMELFIQDMVSDKTIWKQEFTDFEPEDEESLRKIMNNQELWKKYKIKIENKLSKFGIKQDNKIDFKKGNLHKINGKQFQFGLKIKDKKMEIKCSSKGKGDKTILKGKEAIYDQKEYYIAGIIKSPFENRVLIMSNFLEHGFEFIIDIYPLLTGCDLNKGL